MSFAGPSYWLGLARKRDLVGPLMNHSAYRKRSGVSTEELVRILDDYNHWYNEKRGKESLGGVRALWL